MVSGGHERRWFWLTLTLSSVTIVGFVFAVWELIETRFFREADYRTLHYLYITRGIGSALLLAFWAAWFVIRERRETEEQLRESRERYRGLLEFAPGAVAVYDPDLTVREWNIAAEKLYGFAKQEAMGRSLPTIAAQAREALTAILHQLEAGVELPDVEAERIARDGSRVPVQLNVSMFRDAAGRTSFLEVTYDIRERVRLRQTLLSIEKLTTMGQMASGTAHHLNTPLASMLLRIRMARKASNPGPDLDELESSVRFCQQFVRRLLDFSRRPEARKQPEPVVGMVQSVIAFVNPQLLAKGTMARTEIEALAGVQVLADRNEIEALLLILLTNALDTIGTGGLIRVAGRVQRDEFEIAVHDNGPGIDPAHLPHIFEPFFTTKPVGVGTGLGLAIAGNIVHEHGGTIVAASTLGVGTTMTVRLPVWHGAAARQEACDVAQRM